jgi:hypothetical protein
MSRGPHCLIEINVMVSILGLLPPPTETFEDMTSDEAISNIAFYGFGQVLLKRSSKDENNYEVDTTALGSLPVRPEYAKLGANAVFSKNAKLLHIFVSNLDKIVLPGDEEWEHAKFAWKVSLIDFITIGPHLVHCHWIISNVAHIAARYESKILNREVGSKKFCHN